MKDFPVRQFSFTEKRIMEASDEFSAWLRGRPHLTQEQRLTQWRDFLARWDSDLKAIGWRRFEKVETR